MLKAPPVDEQQLQFQAFLGTAPGTAPQLTGLPPSLRALLPSAHAYDISFWDVASIIGSLVGLDSIQVIWDQMANLATGREFDPVVFSVAVLDVLTIFPPAAALKPVAKYAKVAITAMNRMNPRASRYLAGLIDNMYKKAKGRDFSAVFQSIAFFIIAADMMLDEEAREGLAVMVGSITSTEDFLGWIEYFSLADPELLSATAAGMSQPHQYVSSPLGDLFPVAHARVPAGAGRLYGQMLKEIAPAIQKAGGSAASSVRRLANVASGPSAQAARIRGVAFRGNLIKGVFNIVRRAGLPNLRNWLLSYNGQRISPLALILTTVYLENEIDEGRLFPDTQHPFDQQRNRNQLNRLYREAVPATMGGWPIAKAHGASYHLVQLATTQAMGLNVLGIEVAREVPVFRSATQFNALDKEWRQTERYLRRIDIVTGTALHDDETWWEVKSWRAVSKSNRKPKQSVGKWTFNQGRKDAGGSTILAELDGDAEVVGRPHQQFSLDRIALNVGAFLPSAEMTAKPLTGEDDDPPTVKTSGLHWNFHKFTSGVNRDIVNPRKNLLEDALAVAPNGNKGAFRVQSVSESRAKSTINLGASQQLMDILKEKGYDLAQEAIDDLPETLE